MLRPDHVQGPLAVPERGAAQRLREPRARIRRKGFIPRLELYANQLVEHGKTLAAKAGRPYEYRQGSLRKEVWANEIIRRDRLTEGLVGVLRVRRRRERDGEHRMVWCPMNKSVANMHHVERVARAANHRYLEALSVVNDPAPSYRQVERLAERHEVAQRSYAGFNPARRDDIRLFQAVLDGNNLPMPWAGS